MILNSTIRKLAKGTYTGALTNDKNLLGQLLQLAIFDV